MGKVVYNACFGGFGLSEEAVLRYAEIKGLKLYADRKYSFPMYYLCPVEEFYKMYKEAERKFNYEEVNKLHFSDSDIERDDPVLVQVVEELGSERASGFCSKLAIRELEPGTLYRITEYDGAESVETREDVDWKVAK